MKTRYPLIVTARVAQDDLEPFDLLRRLHFPPERNFLQAHLTMFHRLPGEYVSQVIERMAAAACGIGTITAEVHGVRHLGAGVAFSIASPELQALHAELKAVFAPWLGPQDMQKWQPHITVQNRVSKTKADRLHGELLATFHPHQIKITGLDLWRYLGGPWQHQDSVMFTDAV